MAGEVSPDTFMKVYDYVMADEEDKYAMMFTDLHRKDSHPSMFRKNYKDFIIFKEDEESKPKSTEITEKNHT